MTDDEVKEKIKGIMCRHSLKEEDKIELITAMLDVVTAYSMGVGERVARIEERLAQAAGLMTKYAESMSDE